MPNRSLTRASRKPALTSGSTLEAERQQVAEELLALIVSIRRSVRRHGQRPVEFSQLTGAQLELVRLVRRRPGASIADAAQELKLAPNTVSTLVHQLTDSGLLLRIPDQSDRRVARLELSVDMQRKVDAWQDRRTLALDAAIAGLSQRDQRRLADALPALARLAMDLEDREVVS